jgi:DNA integrity scanning protein DisA with diadenylate cyclase activity
MKPEIRKRRLRIKQKRKIERKKKKAAYTSPSKGLRIVQQLFKTIVHFYPTLFDEMQEIEDYRKKSNYKLAELITACIAMFIFKESSRNAFNNDRIEGKFKRNYEKVFKMRLPHMDTVDKVVRKLAENELGAALLN